MQTANRSFRRNGIYLCSVLLLIASMSCAAKLSADQSGSTLYNPLTVSNSPIQHIDLTIQDRNRNRMIPLRVYLPANAAPAAVILFSHGLGGTREGNTYLGKHWASRGYVAVFLQHPGSDDSVWRDKPVSQRLGAMQQAASLQNFRLRVQDIPVTLNQLEIWNRTPQHPLSGRLNLSEIGMSGHSFGALTTQAVSGQSLPGQGTRWSDPRIRAAIMFSPSSPRRGNPTTAFSSVKIPWMLMTGTKDIAPVGDADLTSRLSVYPNLPPGNKYELVLYNAEHSAFTDRTLPGDSQARNPNHHRVILALSTAFWDAYLHQDANARSWLGGQGARSMLEPKDRWQFK